jgi:serine/threonine-protein kinase RsbW
VPRGSWTYPAQPESVRVARGRVAQYAIEHCVPEPPLDDLKLAVTEAMTNSVVHAFRGAGGAGTFTVAIEVCPRDRVIIRVCDDGAGMAPRVDSPGLGLGLGIIRMLADSTEVRTPADGRGTEIAMTFALAG